MKFVFYAVLCGVVVATVPAAGLQLAPGKIKEVTQLTEAEVDAVLAPYARRDLTTAEATQAAEALTQALHAAGAFAAKVYLRQDDATGLASLEVIEGRLAEDGIVLKGDSRRVVSQLVRDQLAAALVPGSVVTSRKLERAILLTNDLPGIATTRNTLLPGDNVGEARLEVTPVDGARIKGSVYADNFGSPYTGRYRLGAVMEINSPFHRGDQVTLGANATDFGSLGVDLDASLPLGHQGLRFGVSGSHLAYRTDLATHYRGRSSDAGAYLRYPFIRSRRVNLYGELHWNWTGKKDLNDADTISDRTVRVGSIQFHGDYADNWGGGGMTTGQVEIDLGHLNLSDYASNDLLDSQTAKTAGGFSRATWRLGRMQRLSGNWQSFVEASGQFASKNLDSSQSLAFGGPYYFTGYEAGEIMGDKGQMLHADLRYNVPATVWGGRQQWSVFYNLGDIRTHAVEIIGGILVPGVAENRYTVQSAGLGFSQQWARWKVQGALGHRIHNEIPAALLAGGDRLHLWLHVTYNY